MRFQHCKIAHTFWLCVFNIEHNVLAHAFSTLYNFTYILALRFQHCTYVWALAFWTHVTTNTKNCKWYFKLRTASDLSKFASHGIRSGASRSFCIDVVVEKGSGRSVVRPVQAINKLVAISMHYICTLELVAAPRWKVFQISDGRRRLRMIESGMAMTTGSSTYSVTRCSENLPLWQFLQGFFSFGQSF